jgi:hypothetical protein
MVGVRAQLLRVTSYFVWLSNSRASKWALAAQGFCPLDKKEGRLESLFEYRW